MNRQLIVGIMGAALTVSTLSAAAAETYTYRDLVARYTDMARLATLPADGERAGEASSYDRASKYDAAADQYTDWDRNGDGTGFIREEGDQVVMAELEGPGVIWRVWSAAAAKGHVRLFLDGAAEPAVDMPFEHFFKNGPFAAWTNLSYPGVVVWPQGWSPGGNLYVPIPFQKSCKITADKGSPEIRDSGWGKYFQFNYTLFPPGTTVPTFKLPLSADDTAALDELNAKVALAAYRGADAKTLTVPAGGSVTVGSETGSGAVTALRVRLTDLPADAEAARTLLRQLTLTMTWDGADKPAVWSPLGDFFGFLGGAKPYETWAAGMTAGGEFYARWFMPFARGAEIKIGNDSPLPVTLSCAVAHQPLTVSEAAKLGRFHAKWHRDVFLPRADREIDWPLLVTKGRGRFVGVALHVWSPSGGWWGEGDEKFFVNGEQFPSLFGTGAEDYFGYAWCSPTPFARPYHAQPINESNAGHVENLRWHIADDVPFQTEFAGYLEKYYRNTNPRPFGNISLFAATAFWYQAADGDDAYEPLPVTERVGYWTPWRGEYIEPGVIEAESMPRTNATNPGHTQTMWHRQPGVWSDDRQLWWITDRRDDALLLTLTVGVAGQYKLIARFTKAPGFGIYQAAVDGENIGAPVDLYQAPEQGFKGVSPAEPVVLGTLTLSAGAHELKLTPVGKNPACQERAAGIGIDYFKLEPVR
ncbi:MAG: DUF2961 domain-containing protein [Verrucomicrobiales bacterium]|nr:DUF2961 domain-containing protein [Verrucomicrobiales bacterium]